MMTWSWNARPAAQELCSVRLGCRELTAMVTIASVSRPSSAQPFVCALVSMPHATPHHEFLFPQRQTMFSWTLEALQHSHTRLKACHSRSCMFIATSPGSPLSQLSWSGGAFHLHALAWLIDDSCACSIVYASSL